MQVFKKLDYLSYQIMLRLYTGIVNGVFLTRKPQKPWHTDEICCHKDLWKRFIYEKLNRSRPCYLLCHISASVMDAVHVILARLW